ncbi:MAG: M23 family metallopeptidase [Candidatus Sericytochromatia bacterium]
MTQFSFKLAAAGALLLSLAACGGGGNPLVPQLRPVEGGHISSGYGPREVHPIYGAATGGHHDGYDFAVGPGSPIRASMAGTVRFAAWKGGYGKTVILEHADGYSTLYGHAERLEVSEGQTVSQGQVIARVGSTGISTGPHLHYELRRHGRPVDPGAFDDELPPVAVAAAIAQPVPRQLKAKVAPPRPAAPKPRLPQRPMAGWDVQVPDWAPGRGAIPG